ncbi:hypothetical protein TWF694_011716 [Orbilia ellipsospora]|uniref:Uncharacterized protein n=1 Tax=Orbilia ellipsospora TaxID=2528407 RepID=A0AAV9X622_9PEZI
MRLNRMYSFVLGFLIKLSSSRPDSLDLNSDIVSSEHNDTTNPIHHRESWAIVCYNSSSATGQDISPSIIPIAVQNIISSKTQALYTPNHPNCSVWWNDLATSVVISICGQDSQRATISASDVAARVSMLTLGFENSVKAETKCNWQQSGTELANSQNGSYIHGSIQYIGEDAKENWRVEVARQGDYPVWFNQKELSSSNVTSQPLNYTMNCIEKPQTQSDPGLSMKEIQDTRLNIQNDLVGPFLQSQLSTSICKQYYCDNSNNVSVSLCGAGSETKQPTGYVTDLMDKAMTELSENDPRINCTWIVRTDATNKCYFVDNLGGVFSNGKPSGPPMSITKLESNMTCDKLFAQMQLPPSNTLPLPDAVVSAAPQGSQISPSLLPTGFLLTPIAIPWK